MAVMQRDALKPSAQCIVFMDQGSCISFSKGTFFSIPFCIKHIVHFCYQIVSTLPVSSGCVSPAPRSSNVGFSFLLFFFCWEPEVLVVYLHKRRLFCLFYNRGITSEGLFFIIGFYEVFKKKSFKQCLCLACNTRVWLSRLSHSRTDKRLPWLRDMIKLM